MLDVSTLGPRLETDRLVLRVPEERDTDDLIAVMSDEETARHIGGVQSPPPPVPWPFRAPWPWRESTEWSNRKRRLAGKGKETKQSKR